MTKTRKEVKLSNNSLEFIREESLLNEEQITKWIELGLISGKRISNKRMFTNNDGIEFYPKFTYGNSTKGKHLPKMIELKTKIEKLIDEYTTVR